LTISEAYISIAINSVLYPGGTGQFDQSPSLLLWSNQLSRLDPAELGNLTNLTYLETITIN